MKTVFYNILIFFVIANVLYWAIPVYTTISMQFRPPTDLLRSAGLQYKSSIGWQINEIKSQNVNVGGQHRQRRTVNSGIEGGPSVYFFGGSAMWGVGTFDNETIPSRFSAATGIHSENFAVPGYTAHQGLIALLQLLQAGHRPDLVVFYDGANDVWAKCRREHDANSQMWESDFRHILSDSRPESFSHHFRAVTRLAARIWNEMSQSAGPGVYDCAENSAKSEAIVENLIRDWQFASQLSRLSGARFMGILQPVAYLTGTGAAADRVAASRNLEPQYKTVYPRIQAKIARSGELHDLVSIFERDESVYDDFVHVNAAGNDYVANKIVELAAPLGLKR